MARLGRLRKQTEENTELNMVPIMNMFMVLIPFLLMSAAFYNIKAVNTSIPVHSNAPAQETPVEKEIKITVVLELKADEVRISALSDQVEPKELLQMETSINRPAGGDMSIVALADFLKKIKMKYPASDTLLLIPDENVLYREIIQAMDCVRNHESGTLFPNVVLSGSLG